MFSSQKNLVAKVRDNYTDVVAKRGCDEDGRVEAIILREAAVTCLELSAASEAAAQTYADDGGEKEAEGAPPSTSTPTTSKKEKRRLQKVRRF